MLRSWISRIATAAALALIVIIIDGGPVLAQTSAYSRMGLYADEARSSSDVSYAGPYTEATVYVYFAPSSRGVHAAEFSIVYPANVLPADVTTNPLISVNLGDLSTGVSFAFLDCQTDWVWSHRQRLFLTSADRTFVKIAASSLSGEYQVASCELGNPLEPVFFSSLLGVNAACEPDTTHPLLESAGNATLYSVSVHFSEPILKIPALIPANYKIASAGDSSVTVPVSSTEFLSDGRSVTLYVSESLSSIGSEFVIHASGVYDSWGNEAPSWSSVTFNLYDLVPPRLVSASATIDSCLRVVFNEPMSPATATNPNNYSFYDYWGNPVASHAYRARLLNDSTFVLHFDTANLLPTYIRLTLKVANVTDLSGHVISPYHTTTTFWIRDIRPPFLVTAQASGKRLIEADFNELLDRASAGTRENYKVYNKSDSLMAYPLAVAGAYLLSDGKRVRLGVEEDAVLETTYILRVVGIRDIYDNRITVPDTIEFPWPDIYPPVPVTVTPLWSTLLNVVFDEPLDETTAEVASHYEVCVMSDSMVTIPVSGAVLQTGGATVQISLGASLEAGLSYAISISNVMDARGNAIIDTTISTTFADVDALLADFTASFQSGAVEITWRLSRMDDGVRFSMLRKEEGAADFTALAQNIEAHGLSFIYRDESAEPGLSYRYRVQYADAWGSHVLFETEAVAVPALPLTLNQNWPNPFNPSTTIFYYLPEAGPLRLDIFDIAGHRIACLVNGNKERGFHHVLWNGTGESGSPAATGVYIYRLTTGRETLSRKMVLVR